MKDSGDNHQRPDRATPRVFDRALLLQRRARAVRQACEGERPDFLLAWVANDIADRISVVTRDFGRILCLGAHTGAVTSEMRRMFPKALVVEADQAPEMLAGREGHRVVADEELLPFAKGAFDLIVSGLSLQCVNDLPGTLVQVRRALQPDGLFVGAMLGGGTLQELRAALTEAELEIMNGVSPRVAPFADVRDLGGLLQRAGFALPVSDADAIDVTYGNMFELLRDLRGMGATNVLMERRRGGVARAFFSRAAEIYQERFAGADGRVRATFEILTMTAWAPDASQQQPLAPGSARVRLADALGVKEIKAGGKPGR